MAVNTLSSLVTGRGYELAVDSNYPKDKFNGAFVLLQVTGLDGTAGLTTFLSLTGAFVINVLALTVLTVDDIAQVKLTVDGVVVWDVDPLTNSVSEKYIGSLTPGGNEFITCRTSFLFQIDTDADSDVTMQYLVRPIL